nr:uncharacterized protein C1orf158 homolog isoform X1 [Columba livia]
MGTMNRWFYGQAVPRITRGSQHTSSRTGAPFCPSFSTGVLRNLSPTQPDRQFQQPGGVVLVKQGNMDGENWWKVKPKYSTKVLIGNWVEDRARLLKSTAKPGSSIYSTDFVSFPDHKPDQLLRRTLAEKYEGLPLQYLFTHHDEPRSRYLVSEYDDKYNRHGYNPVLPPLRTWNGRRLSWIPQKSDFPIIEPPTNYGLLEYLMKKWYKKEAGVMNSVYTVSYQRPPISPFDIWQLKHPTKTRYVPSSRGRLPTSTNRILDYEGGQKYLEAVSELVRARKPREASA